jgi:type II secretory pathway predicted ATPase ExeA
MADYQKFWEITGPVFVGRPDPRQIFLHNSLKPQIEKLLEIIRQPKSIVVVHGEPGTGKTVLASWLHSHIEYKTHEVLLLLPTGPDIESGWLIGKVCQFMCGAVGAKQPIKKQFRLTSIAMDQLIEEGRTLVVIIDNAEKLLNTPNIEELIDLFAIQALSGHCLSIILVGDSALPMGLANHDKIAGMISLFMEMPPLLEADLSKYIAFHSKNSGLNRSPFTASALAAIAAVSRGNPAIINRIAENCLIECANAHESFVNDLIVLQACRNVLPKLLDTKKMASGKIAGIDIPTPRESVGQPPQAPRMEQTAPPPQQRTSTDRKDSKISEDRPPPVNQNKIMIIPPVPTERAFVELEAITAETSAFEFSSMKLLEEMMAPMNANSVDDKLAKVVEIEPKNVASDEIFETVEKAEESKVPLPIKKESGIVNLSSLFRRPEKKKPVDSGNGTEK